MDNGSAVAALVLVLAVVAVVAVAFLAFRQLVLWYLRVPEQIEVARQAAVLLREIRDELRRHSVPPAP